MPSAMSLGRDNGLPADMVAFSTHGERYRGKMAGSGSKMHRGNQKIKDVAKP
jgi:hypothetical protein